MTKTPLKFSMNPVTCPPFVASLSEKLRLACTVMPSVKEHIAAVVRGVVAEVTSHVDVVESLKKENVPGVVRAMRQLDVKDADNVNVLFKTFTFWDTDRGCWCILVESADENYFENQHQPVGRG